MILPPLLLLLMLLLLSLSSNWRIDSVTSKKNDVCHRSVRRKFVLINFRSIALYNDVRQAKFLQNTFHSIKYNLPDSTLSTIVLNRICLKSNTVLMPMHIGTQWKWTHNKPDSRYQKNCVKTHFKLQTYIYNTSIWQFIWGHVKCLTSSKMNEAYNCWLLWFYRWFIVTKYDISELRQTPPGELEREATSMEIIQEIE